MIPSDKKLSEIFNVEPTPVVSNSITEVKVDAISKDKEIEVKFVKQTMIEMIEKGKDAVDELRQVARDSEKSRDYEVLFNGIKSVTEIAERLVKVDEVTKPQEKEKPQSVNQTAVFVGSTAELAKLFKQS